MAGVSYLTLRGYVLEELLAYLIRNTGYRLLVDADQDTDELENRANGLVVRGRGGVHQVDVLGELAWIPAFTFPIRLFVEAKARERRSGIGDVRNAVGVITDVNQNYGRASTASNALVRRYSYRYALFSTSGFSQAAAEYALAHQLSLVDLSAPDFADLVVLADDIATLLWRPEAPRRAQGYVRDLREALRRELGTWPEEVPTRTDSPSQVLSLANWGALAQRLRTGVDAIGELFVGMANGPYLLLLRATNAERFIALLEANPVQDVTIHWSRRIGNGTHWTVRPVSGEGRSELTFTLPATIAAWIFDEDADARRRAAQFKERFLSTITIYRYVGGHDRLYRLVFSRAQLADVRPNARAR